MIILSIEHILEIHAIVIESTGGGLGLRDLGRLEAAIATQTQNVFDKELYPSVTIKSAALIRSLIADHPFVDGNKRTAILSGLTLLKLNNITFKAQPGDIEDFAVKIAAERLDVPLITSWLESNIVI